MVEDDLMAAARARADAEGGVKSPSSGTVADLESRVRAGKLDSDGVDGSQIGYEERVVRTAQSNGGIGEIQYGAYAFHADEVVRGGGSVADEGIAGDCDIASVCDGEGVVRARRSHSESPRVVPTRTDSRDGGGVTRGISFMADAGVFGDQRTATEDRERVVGTRAADIQRAVVGELRACAVDCEGVRVRPCVETDDGIRIL